MESDIERVRGDGEEGGRCKSEERERDKDTDAFYQVDRKPTFNACNRRDNLIFLICDENYS